MTATPPDSGPDRNEARRDAPQDGASSGERVPRTLRTAAHRLLADRAARWAVIAGGFSIIASILGILLFILWEIVPLTGGAEVASTARLPLDAGLEHVAINDEYRETAILVNSRGTVRAITLPGGETLFERSLLEDLELTEDVTLTELRAHPAGQRISALLPDGRALLARYDFTVTYEDDSRAITPRVTAPELFTLDPDGRPLRALSAAIDPEDDSVTLAALGGDDEILVYERLLTENVFTEEFEEEESRMTLPSPAGVREILLDNSREHIYAALDDGRVALWKLAAGAGAPPVLTEMSDDAPSAIQTLFGDNSLVVGRESGTLEVWFRLRDDDNGGEHLVRVREMPRHEGAVLQIVPSRRDKGFLVQDAAERVTLYHSTSERMLWRSEPLGSEPRALYFAPKADGALVVTTDALHVLDIDNPHPDIGLRTLLSKVWYENYDKPEYVWQSSSATDDFEPKLSLVPLLIGTLKGTLYSLFLAIPLGVFGAMYTSQFLAPSLKRVVKPTVEIMAALPSVVLGFLAGLWLAPRVERGFATLVLLMLLLPAVVVLAGLLWRRLPRRIRHGLPGGSEIALYSVAIIIGAFAAFGLAEPLEALFFNGSLLNFITEVTGTPYDQRNALVVGLAMGFAVIPIIFSVSEDAFSNVPRTLVSGSLALGANRWQTVMRVVLPTASPGIFSAIMIGFGRAVGETMIVLMATGNTPIMDWNAFNGFRTLSANIAVEIPEAPLGGTLYRTLFLSALALFLLTFTVNTVAELVRHRLRRRYANL